MHGLKSQGWKKLTPMFNTKAKANYKTSQLQSKLSELKKKYLIVHTLRNNSGFRWDETTKMPTATYDVWDRYIESHPKASEFRNKRFFFYEKLDAIFCGKFATGKYARSSASDGEDEAKDDNDVNDDDFETDSDDSGGGEEEGGSVTSAVTNRSKFSTRNSNAAKQIAAGAKRTAGGPPPQPKPPKKKTKQEQDADAETREALTGVFQRLADRSAVDTKLTQALKCFTEKFSGKGFSTEQRFRFKKYLAANLHEAEMFLQLDDEEKEFFVYDTLESL